jgi:tape measure domain-containing protein
MPSIDERVVAMSFENQVFETRVAQTMATLSKLDATIKNVGANSGFDNIEKAASKVSLQQPMSALDKLKAKLGFVGDTKGFSDIEKGADKVTLQAPMSALDKLKSRLGFVGDTKGFADIEKAADQVTLSGLGQSLENMGSKFTALQSVAFGVFASIGAKITGLATHLSHAFGLGPVHEGFKNYETNINAVQTILANTGLTGAKGLAQVTGKLNELNKYANLTVYNFAEMAKNIGTFTAAGVDLKTATASIKGIANLAALSGSSSEQASSAMYQLSQAIAAGRVNLQDWNSVVNAGIGGKVFQTALANTAVAMGKLGDHSVKLVGPMKQLTIDGQTFRNSIMTQGGAPSWLSSGVLTKTLEHFTGDMSDAQLASEGFNKAQIKAIQAQAKVAVDSATKIKTVSQLMQALKEEVASSWSAVFKTLFGDINQAKALFSPLHITIENALRNPIDAFNKQLKEWSKLGGRTVLLDALKTGFHSLGQILGTVKAAFRDIFPPQTGKSLFNMTKNFSDFVNKLKPSKATLEALRSTFKGFFAVLSIGWYIVKKVAGVLFSLLGLAGKGAGPFLKITGGVGEFLASLQKAIVQGDALGGFFKGITNILRVPLDLLKALGSAFAGMFGHVSSKKAQDAVGSVGNLSDKLKPLSDIFKKAGEAGKRFIQVLNKIFEPITKVINKIGHAFGDIGHVVADAFQHADTSAIFSAIQTGFLGGIFLALRKAINQGGGGLVVNPLKKLSGALGLLTGNLKAMQQAIQAHTLLAIAAAIGILAVGILILSKIDPKKLTAALEGMAVGMGELVAMLALLDKSKGTILGLPLIGFGLTEIAAALVILAAAMKIFASMSWKDIIKGLVGVGGALLAVSVGVKAMSGPQMLLIGPGLIAIAFGLNIMAVAMKIMASLSWNDITKGLVGITGGLLALGLGLQSMGPEILLLGPGLILVSIGLAAMGGAIAEFGKMNYATLIQGVLGIAGAIVIIGTALRETPTGPEMLLQAAGLTILAVALTGIAGAVGIMGHLNVGTIVKGIIGLGGALLVFAVGLDAMNGTLPGALALAAAAVALDLLVPALALLGAIPFDTMLKSLGYMAGILVTLGVVGGLASAGLTAIGVALVAIGLGVVAVGAGIYLIVKALVLLGNESIKSTGILIAAITAFIVSIPKMVIEFIKGVVQILGAMAEVAPKVVTAMGKIINSMLQIIINAVPKIADTAKVLIGGFISILDSKGGPLIDAGFRFFMHFLSGVEKNIGAIATKGANIAVNFLNAVTQKLPDLVTAGARFVIKLLNGIGQHVGDIVAAAAGVIGHFLTGIGNQLPGILRKGAWVLGRFLQGIANAIPTIAKHAAHVVVAFLNGITNNLHPIRVAAQRMVTKLIKETVHFLVGMAGVGAKAVLDFIDGVAKAIIQNGPRIKQTAQDLGHAFAQGTRQGLQGFVEGAVDIFPSKHPWSQQIQGIIQQAQQGHNALGALQGAGAAAGVHKMAVNPQTLISPIQGAVPAATTAGQNVTDGLANGIQNGIPTVKKAMVGAAQAVAAGTTAVVAAAKPKLDTFHAFQAEDYWGTLLGKSIVNGMRVGMLGMAGAMQEGVTGPIRALLAKNKDLHAFGAFLGGEFQKGLTGGLWGNNQDQAVQQIQSSFAALRGKLGEEAGKLRDQIKQDQDKLKQLLGEKNKNWNQINALRGNIANEQGLLAASKASSRELLAGMQGEEAVLVKLAAKYEAFTKKLDGAKQKLADLKQARTDAITNYTQQFSELPDIAGLLDDALSNAAMTATERWDALRQKQDDDRKRSQIDQVANYKKALQDQIAATQKYMETLTALRGLKLDDATYKKLLDMGVAGQGFASQLLAGGQGAVDQINSLDTQLTSVAGDLGKNAANSLYNAGIQTAQGFVDGLKQEQKDIREVMTGIAKSMVMALKLALGIKSPSRVFAELGVFTAQGLAEGLSASSNLVQDSAAGLGNDAADALTNSLSNVADSVQNGINTDITITPVLDLSQVKKDASQIQDLSNVVPITAAASFGQAAAISDQQQAASDAGQAAGGDTIIDVKLEQNNTSPKALDDIEIYRQTKNQLSQVKGALGLATAT